MIIVDTQLNKKDYIKLNFYIAYKKFVFKLFFWLGIFLVFIGLINFLAQLQDPPFGQLLFFIGYTSLFPLLILVSSILNYNSDARIKENIKYIFDESILKVEGESFKTELTYEKLYKVHETKKALLIYQNKRMANVILKPGITDAQIVSIKNILAKHSSIRKNWLKAK